MFFNLNFLPLTFDCLHLMVFKQTNLLFLLQRGGKLQAIEHSKIYHFISTYFICIIVKLETGIITFTRPLAGRTCLDLAGLEMGRVDLLGGLESMIGMVRNMMKGGWKLKESEKVSAVICLEESGWFLLLL